MPKSRRKAAASKASSRGIVKDFVKKKERLGRKSQPANATNVSVRSRRVHLPAPASQAAVADAASKRGLSFEQLVVRCAHYSAGTRTAALNGLTRAFGADDAAASAHARADHNRVLRMALAALHDDAAAVRIAANALLAAVLAHAPAVAPFAPLLAARLVACLSHIRRHVQLSGAHALKAVFGDAGVDARDVFGDGMHALLAAVSDLLEGVKGQKDKQTVLDALASVLAQPEDRAPVEMMKSPRSLDTSVFYYHRSNIFSIGRLQKDSPASSASADWPEVCSDLVKRVVDVVLELLPTHEAKREAAATSLLLSASRALYWLLSVFNLSEKTTKMVLRCLQKWSKERNRQQDRADLHAAHNFLAASAICIDELELASAYVSPVLSLGHLGASSGNGHLSAECLALKILQCSQDGAKESSRELVLTSWMTRFLSSTSSERPFISASSASILRCVIDEFLDCVKKREWQMPGLEENGWKVLIRLPQAIAEVSDAGSSSGQRDECPLFLGVALSQLALASRLCCRIPSQKNVELRKSVEEHLLTPNVLEHMHVDMVAELVSVLFYTDLFQTRRVIQAAVHAVHVGSYVSLEFALRLLIVFEANLVNMAECEDGTVLLDLYTAAGVIMCEARPETSKEAARQNLVSDVANIARRIFSRCSLSE